MAAGLHPTLSFIAAGTTVGMSGFTGSGYPKAVPLALAERSGAEHAAGNPFSIRVWTGASTGPELDGALAKGDGIEFRLPSNSDPIASLAMARDFLNGRTSFDFCNGASIRRGIVSTLR